MAFLEKLIGSSKKEELIDIEEVINNMDVDEESLYDNADALVKPLTLNSEQDVSMIIDETKKGNIILLNIADISKRNALKLREFVELIQTNVSAIDGDIARISTDRVLITPAKVKIIKKKEGR